MLIYPSALPIDKLREAVMKFLKGVLAAAISKKFLKLAGAFLINKLILIFLMQLIGWAVKWVKEYFGVKKMN